MEHLKRLTSQYNKEEFLNLNEEITFDEYLRRVYENPFIIRTAYQRLYDMIASKGSYEFQYYKKKLDHYKFFDGAVFELEETLDALVNFFKAAAHEHGMEKRVLLLHGPVGSAKSTILRKLKRGLEEYSKTPEGAWYSFKWVNLPTGKDGIYTHCENECPMHEEPLKLLPFELRNKVLDELNGVLRDRTPPEERFDLYNLTCDGELDPRCRVFMKELMKRYDGDVHAVLEKHIMVVRKVYSESDRCGIATFQPKDEKNQDATELSGDIAFDKIGHFGDDADARAFNFNGELCCGNRGVVEFIEMLKLAQEFLYDLLGASQERQIKPKKFAQVTIDEAIIGHTNTPEYEKLLANNFMEALKDRMVTIDVPYIRTWNEEIKVLEMDYSPSKVKKHIAPHTLEIAALWAVLTRLEEDDKVTLVQKARLYNGESLPQHNEETVKELRTKYPKEGMARGVSVRYVQDKISFCLSRKSDYINPFMLINEIKEGLKSYPLVKSKDELEHYRNCVELVCKELDEILKDEVRKALVGDPKVIQRLCANYIDNIRAYIKNAKVKNKLTGRDEVPNERLMRGIEEKIGIPHNGANDFRRMIVTFIGDLAAENKTFAWDSDPQLKKALEAKLFEDTRHHIRISALNVSESSVVDPEVQEKIEHIKKRLIDQYGYNSQSASDVLEYVGSLFANTEATENED